jgi:hypothetical protein
MRRRIGNPGASAAPTEPRRGEAGQHDVRRTPARDRVDDGNPERVVMAMTGHKTRATFDRYSIASTKDIDVLACPRCGGLLWLIATVEDADAIRAILGSLVASQSSWAGHRRPCRDHPRGGDRSLSVRHPDPGSPSSVRSRHRAVPSAAPAPVVRPKIALDTVVVRTVGGAGHRGRRECWGGGAGAENGRVCHDTGLHGRASRCSKGASVAFAPGAAVADCGCSRPSWTRG